ncbi:MAG: transcription termination/antitermination NusG family protein [Nibricoccus sp.]
MPTSDSTSTELRWLVCHTKPRCEKKFAGLLHAGGLEHYLPLMESIRNYGPGGKKRYLKPLFPGYVFARVSISNKNLLYEQQLIVRTLAVENEPIFLRQIEQVKQLLVSGVELTLKPLFTKGRAVRVTSGPLWGVEGIVRELADVSEILIEVDVLQQGLLVKLPLSHLEVLP